MRAGDLTSSSLPEQRGNSGAYLAELSAKGDGACPVWPPVLVLFIQLDCSLEVNQETHS